MIRVRFGGAKRYRVVLSAIGGGLGVVFFGIALGVTGDWRAALVGVLCAVQLVHCLELLRRLAQPAEVQDGGSWSSARGPVFLTLATCYRGSRSVRGLFVGSSSASAFLPLEQWGHIVGAAFVAAFAQRCRIVEVSLNPHEVSEPALRESAASSGGFMIGADWRWSAPGQLVSPTDRWVLCLDERPTATIEDTWERAPAPTAEEIGGKLRKIAKIGAAMSIGCAGIGAAVSWWTGDLDPLVAGLGYAILVLIAFVVAAFAVGRSSQAASDAYSK